MGLAIFIALVVLIGPVAIFFGADSRRVDDRGWMGRR
jgi:uncharacterized membrane protein